jgi:hypothetical protein
MKKHKQEVARNKYEKFTTDELLSIFKEEARHICKKPNEADSIAESALGDFIKRHGQYIRFI